MTATDCTRTCRIAAGVTGLLVWLSLSGIGQMRWYEGLFLGVVAAVILGAILIWLACSGHPAQDAAEWHPAPHRATPDEDLALRPRGVAAAAMTGMLGDAGGDVGAGDELQRIRGVGPKLEALLNENGVTRFDQIAAWDDARVDHFADLIGRMGGRIRSDDWVGQARDLAAGRGPDAAGAEA